jgi:serine-type D-Ala-D-Ala carboxypeptidase (penicillin-binding protein 5/6)
MPRWVADRLRVVSSSDGNVMRLPARLSALAVTLGLALVTLTAAAPAEAAAHYPGGVVAKGAALEDASTGTMLWSRQLNTERPMGSITKVMTALVVIQAGDLSQRITVPAAVVKYVKEHDASSAGLHPGDVLTARELLEGLLLPSGADAAYTLAKAYGPGLTAFIAKMNTEAAALGMVHTHFANFDGLPYPTEYTTYSTPADLVALGVAAMKYAAFRSIVDQQSYHLAGNARHHAYTWNNTNTLLKSYPGAIGIKTGNTLAAGYCLLFAAQRGSVLLIGVVLHSSNTDTVAFSDATKVLNWGFRHA